MLSTRPTFPISVSNTTRVITEKHLPMLDVATDSSATPSDWLVTLVTLLPSVEKSQQCHHDTFSAYSAAMVDQ